MNCPGHGRPAWISPHLPMRLQKGGGECFAVRLSNGRCGTTNMGERVSIHRREQAPHISEANQLWPGGSPCTSSHPGQSPPNQAKTLFFEMFGPEGREAFRSPRSPPSQPSRPAMPFAQASGVAMALLACPAGEMGDTVGARYSALLLHTPPLLVHETPWSEIESGLRAPWDWDRSALRTRTLAEDSQT